MSTSRTKLSGAEIAAQLGDLSLPANRPLPPSPAPAPAPPPVVKPAATADAGAKSRGGRPAKAGVDGVPLNVRLAQSDHLALARIAAELMVPGRPLPTVQDVVRGLIRGALRDPEALKRLVRQGEG
jgi:hypothetical protein